MAYPDGRIWELELQIVNTKIDGTLTNWPAYIPKSVLLDQIFDADGIGPALSTGGDLIVYDSSKTTRLPLDVSVFSTNNNPALGSCAVFTKVPSVSPSVNTSIYLLWVKAGATQPATGATYGRNDTWSNGYFGVWHKEETTGGVVDSRGLQSNGTVHGSVVRTATGIIENGYEYYSTSSDSDDIEVPGNTTNQQVSDVTMEAWVYPHSCRNSDRFVQKRRTDVNNFTYNMGFDDSSYHPHVRMWTTLGAGGNLTMTGTLTQNAWNYMVGIYDTSAQNIRGQINKNTQETLGGQTGSLVYAGTNNEIDIGGVNGRSGSGTMDGILDEIRLSNVARTKAWLDATYENISDPTNFYVTGTIRSLIPSGFFKFFGGF